MWLHCVDKYVEKSGTGVVFRIDIRWHYEYGNKLSKAAGGRQAGRQASRQAAHADVTPRGAQSK